jgi:hypothetical protein
MSNPTKLGALSLLGEYSDDSGSDGEAEVLSDNPAAIVSRIVSDVLSDVVAQGSILQNSISATF